MEKESFILPIVLTAVSLILYSIFSGAQRKFINISRTSLKKLKDDGIRNASRMLWVITNKQQFFIALSLGKIIAIVFGTALAIHMADQFLVLWTLLGSTAFGVLLMVTVFLFFSFDHFFSRILVPEDYEKSIPRLGFLLFIFHGLFLPVTAVVELTLSRWLNKNNSKEQKEEAFLYLVESETEAGNIALEEKAMIEGIISFGDTSVKEVMVPRIDVVAAEITISLSDLITLFNECGHTRIPVYREKIDDIPGIIYAKDLLEFLESDKSFKIETIMREPYFIPENKKIKDLLTELKKNKIHMAIVVDEYGGTSGIITMEDLLEEIVGEIQDEYDDEVELYRWIDDNTLEVDGKIDIHDLNELMGINIPDEGFETLGGFIYDQMGAIPKPGESLDFEKVHIEISRIAKHRIARARITRQETIVDKEKEEE